MAGFRKARKNSSGHYSLAASSSRLLVEPKPKKPTNVASSLRCYGCALIFLGLLGFLSPTGAMWAFACGCVLTCCDTEHTDESLVRQLQCARQCAILGIVFCALTIIGCLSTGFYLYVNDASICNVVVTTLAGDSVSVSSSVSSVCVQSLKNSALLILAVPSAYHLLCVLVLIRVISKAAVLENTREHVGVHYTALDGSKSHQALSLAAERFGFIAGCGTCLFLLSLFVLFVTANDPNKPKKRFSSGYPAHLRDEPLASVDYMVKWMLITSGGIVATGMLGTIAFASAAELH